MSLDRRRNILGKSSFLALALLLVPNSINAEINLYGSLNGYASYWSIGVLNNAGIKKDPNAAVSPSYDSGSTFMPIFGASLTMLLNRKWAFTYGFSIGTSKFKSNEKIDFKTITLNTVCGGGYVCTQVAKADDNYNVETSITRQDHDGSVSIAIGKTGINVFLGGKYQTYSFSAENVSGTRSVASTYYFVPTPSFSATTSYGVISSARQDLRAMGPAMGVGYTFSLGNAASLRTQLGGLFMLGNATEELAYTDQTIGSVTFKEENQFWGIGGTVTLDFVKPLNEWLFLQLSYKGQYYVMKASARSAALLRSDGSVADKSTNTDSALVNGAKDLFQGIFVAVLFKFF